MWERIGKRFVFKSDNTEEVIKDEENRFFLDYAKLTLIGDDFMKKQWFNKNKKAKILNKFENEIENSKTEFYWIIHTLH